MTEKQTEDFPTVLVQRGGFAVMSYKQNAEETKEWDRFWGSGKVDDYLRYKNCCREKEEYFEENGVKDGIFREERDRFI